jgi:hypothetical protein
MTFVYGLAVLVIMTTGWSVMRSEAVCSYDFWRFLR